MVTVTLPSPFPLTALRLRFTCAAETTLHLGGLRAGSNLRGALVNVMRRATCAGDPSDAAHLAACPVCWLVAANDHPGEERRGYVLTPPIPQTDPKGFPGSIRIDASRESVIMDNFTPQAKTFRVSLEPGELFDFHITLFGEAARYLPYFVLAVPEVGRVGVGPGRGRFALKSIHAGCLLNGEWEVLKEGENLVRPPTTPIGHADIQQAAETFAAQLEGQQPRIQLDFLTPLRLILDERLLKSPDFGVLFGHILKRLDDLSMQHAAGSERAPDERQRLWDLANRVHLVESQTHWEDVLSGSSRTGQKTWISGLVGPATYSAPADVWRELLPWLLWGEIAQVGKDTAKGNGVYRLRLGDDEKYCFLQK